MKALILSYIPTLLRHLVTSLATVGTLLLTRGLITPSDVAAVNSGGSALGAALVIILTPVLSRLAIVGLGKIPLGGLSAASDKVTGWLLWLCIGTAAGLGGFSLPSCSPAQQAEFKSLPVTGTLKTAYGTVSYDANGVHVTVDATSGK